MKEYTHNYTDWRNSVPAEYENNFGKLIEDTLGKYDLACNIDESGSMELITQLRTTYGTPKFGEWIDKQVDPSFVEAHFHGTNRRVYWKEDYFIHNGYLIFCDKDKKPPEAKTIQHYPLMAYIAHFIVKNSIRTRTDFWKKWNNSFECNEQNNNKTGN